MKWVLVLLLVSGGLRSQDSNPLLTDLRNKMDSIVAFSAEVRLVEDISFVNMPDKNATLLFEEGKDLKIEAEEFIMIPKKGLDFTLRELFKYPYIALSTGKDTISGVTCDIIRIIPEDSKADFSIAKLALDPDALRIVKSEISTKKNGVFTVLYYYDQKADILPDKIEVRFAISEVNIPLRYLGKEAEIDKEMQENNKEEMGVFFIYFSDYQISRK